jgi:hypothetical protein
VLDAETHGNLRRCLIAAFKRSMSYGQRHPLADAFGPEGADIAEALTDEVMCKIGFETAEEQRERTAARNTRFEARYRERIAQEDRMRAQEERRR